MADQTVPKLNKRLIYWCLMGVLALSVPALISIASSKEKSDKNDHEHHKPQANINSQDGVVISGMDRFPENYGGVKEFEQELALANPPEEKLEDALAALGTDRERKAAPAGNSYQGEQDNPWHEAKKREQKQRANDHYDARRSDIMFIDNSRAKNKRDSEGAEEEDPMLKMLERS